MLYESVWIKCVSRWCVCVLCKALLHLKGSDAATQTYFRDVVLFKTLTTSLEGVSDNSFADISEYRHILTCFPSLFVQNSLKNTSSVQIHYYRYMLFNFCYLVQCIVSFLAQSTVRNLKKKTIEIRFVEHMWSFYFRLYYFRQFLKRSYFIKHLSPNLIIIIN